MGEGETRAPITFIVGLGNPGVSYAKHRHNVGVWFVEALARQHCVNFKAEKRYLGRMARIAALLDRKTIFIPDTYMNESGRAVSAYMRFYQCLPQQILVVHDELDFPAGTIRLKQGGGHGGHNGVRNIIDHLKSKAFIRLRIGIDQPNASQPSTKSYVLHPPTSHQAVLIDRAITRGLAVMPDLFAGRIESAFRQLHAPPLQPEQKQHGERH